jgi:hypothetical protein
MAKFVEARGRKLHSRGRGPAVHHVRVYGRDGDTPDSRSWFVNHHESEDGEAIASHSFTDPHEMLAHVANSLDIPAPDGEAGEPSQARKDLVSSGGWR